LDADSDLAPAVLCPQDLFGKVRLSRGRCVSVPWDFADGEVVPTPGIALRTAASEKSKREDCWLLVDIVEVPFVGDGNFEALGLFRDGVEGSFESLVLRSKESRPRGDVTVGVVRKLFAGDLQGTRTSMEMNTPERAMAG